MNTNEKIHQAFNNRETVEIENIFKPTTMKKNEKIHQAVREQLQKGKVRFTVDGITELGKNNLKIFRVNEKGNSIVVDALLGYEFISYDGMNVTKWGPTCVTLYTFDILNKKTVGKIKYSDIKIIGKIK